MLDFVRFSGSGLRSQIASFKAQAEELKRRAIDEAKRQLVHTGVTVGIAFLGAILAMMAVVIGLIALYIWVAESEGTYAALAVVGGTTATLSVLLFVVAASRTPARRTDPAPAYRPAVSASAANRSFSASVKQDLLDRTAAATTDALDSTGDLLRTGSRETIFTTLALAVVIGIIVGRRR